jgi:hypothetical protein
VTEHELWVAVFGGVVAWILGKTLDQLLDMWRRRKEPMTMAQVTRYHRVRFAIGFFTFLWLLVATLLALHYAATPFEYGVALSIGAVTVYFWRVARRRWRRMRSSRRK